MKPEEVIEVLDEYRDANSDIDLIRLLKDKIIEEVESHEPETGQKKHDLSQIVKELKEEMDYIESEELPEFSPEQQ